MCFLLTNIYFSFIAMKKLTKKEKKKIKERAQYKRRIEELDKSESGD